MPEATVLDVEDLAVLQDLARGMTNRQLAISRRVKHSYVDQVLMPNLYHRLGVNQLGPYSRAYALAVAHLRHGLKAPKELQPAVALLESGQVKLQDDVDVILLSLLIEGHPMPEISRTLTLDIETLRNRVASLQVDLDLLPFPIYVVAVVALWAKLLPELDLDRPYQFTPYDKRVLLGIIEDASVDEAADELGIVAESVRARRAALRFRLRVRTDVEVVKLAIESQWVTLPDVTSERFLEAMRLISLYGLSRREQKAFTLLQSGLYEGQVGAEMSEELLDMSVHLLLDRMRRHLGISGTAALTAALHWAEQVIVHDTEPSERGSLFTTREIQLLEGMAIGLTIRQTTKRYGGGHVAAELSSLYLRMRASGLYHAVALAARDGLLERLFSQINPDELLPPGAISGDYLAYLEQLASGARLFYVLRALRVGSVSALKEKIAEDQARFAHVPVITQIAILAWRKDIEVVGQPVGLRDTPTDPPAVDETGGAELSGGPPAARPEPPSPAVVPPPGAEAKLLESLLRLVHINGLDNEVEQGRRAISKRLAQFISANFELVVRAIRKNVVDKPEWKAKFNRSSVSDDAGLFLLAVLEGKSLDQIRQENHTYRNQPQEFHRWYVHYVIQVLGAWEAKDAAAIALWAGLVKI